MMRSPNRFPYRSPARNVIQGADGADIEIAPVYTGATKATISADDYDASEGIIVIDSIANDQYDRANFETIFSIDNNTNNNRAQFFHRDSEVLQLIITAGGVSQVSFIFNTFNGIFLSERQRIVMRWKSGALQIYMNGIEVGYWASGITMPAATEINFGQNSGTADLQGTIVHTAFYNQGGTEDFARSLSRQPVIVPGLTYDDNRSGIMVFGQSNESGADLTGSLTYENSFNMINNAGAYVSWSDPWNDDTDNLILGGILTEATPGLSYISLLMDMVAEDGGEWYGIPACKSNTRIDEWGPFIESGLSGTGVPDRVPYNRFWALANRALMAKQAGQIKFIVFGVCESDAIAATAKADYIARCKRVIAELLKVIDMPNIPVVIRGALSWTAALGTAQSVTEAEWVAIQEGGEDLAALYDNYAYADNTDITATLDSNLHIDANAEGSDVAENVFDAYDSLV